MIDAKGTVLKIGAQTVGKLTSIGEVSLTADTEDTTILGDLYKQSEPTLLDAGDVAFSGFADAADTGQTAVRTALTAKTLNTFTVEYSDGASESFSAYVIGFNSRAAEVGGKLKFQATLKPVGAVTPTTSASAGLTNFVVSNALTTVPAPAVGVYEYAVGVATATESVTVTPTAAGVITVNGVVVATGVASETINLGAAVSITTIAIVVTETGKTPKHYTIRVSRP